MHQFCVGAAKGVLSPFVLQEIVMETLQRLSPAHAHNHLRAPAFHQLVQRCQQAYMQVTTQEVWTRVKHLPGRHRTDGCSMPGQRGVVLCLAAHPLHILL